MGDWKHKVQAEAEARQNGSIDCTFQVITGQGLCLHSKLLGLFRQKSGGSGRFVLVAALGAALSRAARSPRFSLTTKINNASSPALASLDLTWRGFSQAKVTGGPAPLVLGGNMEYLLQIRNKFSS